LKLCSKTKDKIIKDEIEYSYPALAVVRRDIRPDNVKKENLVNELCQLEMFQSYVSELFLVREKVIQPYPGTSRVSAKELLDAPKITLDPEYFKRVGELKDIIREARPKYLNGSVINSNVMSILAGSYVNSINRNHRLLIEKW
jgi:hypothetical protein